MNKNIILLIVFSISLILQVQTIIIVSDFVYAPHIGNQRCTGIGENSYIYPGIRSYAMSWFISEDFVNQYIYVFGGLGYDENDEAILQNDLWVLETASETLFNMKFPLSPPSYDFPDYYPLARKSGITWLDEDKKHLYLFGGEGGDPIVGMLNDLWYYSVDENKWTLVSGSEDINNKGDYTSENKRPGARSNALAWFDKDSRKAYIFGGLGYDESTYGILNDLWTYSVDEGKWECIGGCGSVNSLGNYGVQGVPSVLNYPGSRHSSASWYIEQDKMFYMFGGIGYNYEKKGVLNDLWSYSLEDNIWTWISGTNKTDMPGKYGLLGKPSKFAYPGARFSSMPVYAYITGHGYRFIHLFGGGKNEDEEELFNDVWTYYIENNTWTWVSGSSETNVLGKYECYKTYPGSRRSSVVGSGTETFIYGGRAFANDSTSSYLEEVWRLYINGKIF